MSVCARNDCNKFDNHSKDRCTVKWSPMDRNYVHDLLNPFNKVRYGKTKHSPTIYHRLVGCTTVHPIGRPRCCGRGSILSGGCGSVLSEPGLCRGWTGGCGRGLQPLLTSLLQQKQTDKRRYSHKIRRVSKIINQWHTYYLCFVFRCSIHTKEICFIIFTNTKSAWDKN